MHIRHFHIPRVQPGDSARILPSEITPESSYLNRRQVLQGAIAAGLIGTTFAARAANVQAPPRKLQFTHNKDFSTDEAQNSFEDITTYNNYYEFGTSKVDPAMHSQDFKPTPWTIAVSGEAEVTGKFNLEDLIKATPLEERVYRMRCVEAWSMVIPWVGMPLASVLKSFKPTSKAKYVAFKTVYRPSEMPGQHWNSLQWPYVEGLRIDEAVNPLAILAVGLYGQTLLNQNGAPVRLVTPWKYGFKGIKSIVEIAFVERQPPTSWNIAASNEYGFYANVNPNVDHPRWSQARERRIGGGSIFAKQIPTRMYNGYEKEVADLYRGMDLKRYY